MEVEVSEIFAPAAGKRPANFVVLKYFLLGMMFSNAVESILIVPKTLSLMEENYEQLAHLASIYEEHDAFMLQLHELRKIDEKTLVAEKKTFNAMEGVEEKHAEEAEEEELEEEEEEHEVPGHGQQQQHHEKVVDKVSTAVGHKKSRKGPKITFEAEEEPMGGKENEKLIEWMLLVYGIVTMAIGLIAVFKEQDKLLMLFMGTTTLGLLVLFFSGLTLIVFMAILNDVIIALIAFKYLQMMTAPVEAEYTYGGPMSAGGMASHFPEAAYNVDLNQAATYVVTQ